MPAISLLHYFGADFTVKTYWGDTVLHMAARVRDASVVLILLAAILGSSDGLLEELDLDDRTPLQVAGGCNAMINVVLQCCGANVGNSMARISLEAAIREGNLEAVKLFFNPQQLLRQLPKCRD